MNINIPTVNLRNTVRKGLSTLDSMLEPKKPTIGQRIDNYLATSTDDDEIKLQLRDDLTNMIQDLEYHA